MTARPGVPAYAVEEVITPAQLRAFADLPLRLHGRMHHVPTLRPSLEKWWSGNHPQARFGPVRFYLARSASGEVVGRICLHHNPDFDDVVGADSQLFGLTEFTDVEVLRALIDEVRVQGRAAGRTQIVGPMALLPNQTGGVITSGFTERGFMDSPWNPAHYPADYEALGLERIFEGQTWICDDFADLDPDATFAFDSSRIAAESLEVHHGSRRRLRRQLPILRGMLNAAFAQLPYYTEIGADDLEAATDGLAYLLDEKLFLWLTRGGEPVAFVLVVPDVSEFVMAHGGRLGVREQLALLATKKHYREDAILIIKGTVPDAQGHGYLTLLSRELLRNLQSGGYRRLRSTFVGLDNPASAAQFSRMRGRPLQATTFYRGELS